MEKQAGFSNRNTDASSRMNAVVPSVIEDTAKEFEYTKPVIIVKVLPDHMEASLLLHPSSPNTLPPLKQDILAALEEQNIVCGLNMPLIDELCVKPVYYHVFIIARGTPAKTGKDGFVKYLVSDTVLRRPKIGEDGIADYKNIGFPPIVYKNQPLCEIYQPEKGEDGLDIHGNVLEGKYGRKPVDPAGNNTYLNADKSLLLASIDGRISNLYGIVNIIEVLNIDNNVDNATGNINFTGDVIVGGDVVSGFTIKCGGSIVVHGSVEGAILEAGTDISVSAGIFGMDRGSVSAGGSIKCKFIQNCTVRATGNIYADSILFSDVECNRSLELAGRKGALIGGKTVVAGRLIAKSIGTSKHTVTEIDVCAAGTDKKTEIDRLEEELRLMDTKVLKIVQMLARYEDINQKNGMTEQQLNEALNAKERYGALVRRREELRTKLAEMKLEQREAGRDKSYIECRGKIHANTKITFGNAKLVIEDTVANSRIQVGGNGIEVHRL